MDDLPLSIVELRSGELRMVLVTEAPHEVEMIVNNCEERLCTLHRWRLGERAQSEIEEFHTRPDNVIAVRPNQ